MTRTALVHGSLFGTGLWLYKRGERGSDPNKPIHARAFPAFAGQGMNKFQEQIEVWLSRAVPERAVNQCFDIPMVLASDIGLKRSENQDRVAALRIGGKSSGARPFVAVAVADGMGGMRDGAKCAALALSNFFHSLIVHRNLKLEHRAERAISDANNAVFDFAAGKGGTTLSAVILDDDLRPLIIHLGDTRVYAFANGGKIERLTVDDSLEEAVGGRGRDLLQFVGLGTGIQPHIRSVPAGVRHLAITTDGIHSVASSALESILAHAPDLKSASERLTALARWSGGHDNASSAFIDLQAIMQHIHRRNGDGIQLWDPFGTLTTIWITVAGPAPDGRQRQAIDLPKAEAEQESDAARPQTAVVPKLNKEKSPSKRTRKKKKEDSPGEDIQLAIHIEPTEAPETSDEDSR